MQLFSGDNLGYWTTTITSKLQYSGKEEEGKTSHELHVLGMNDDLWDKVHGVGSETWKGCVALDDRQE